MPQDISLWHFFLCHALFLISHREFRLSDDMYAQDSIELLKQSGIDFAQNETRGIDVRHFGELLTVSGVVLNEDVRRILSRSSVQALRLWSPAPHCTCCSR